MVLRYLSLLVTEAVTPELLQFLLPKDGMDGADCDTAEPVWVWGRESARGGGPGQPEPSGPPAGGSGPVSPPNHPDIQLSSV